MKLFAPGPLLAAIILWNAGPSDRDHGSTGVVPPVQRTAYVIAVGINQYGTQLSEAVRDSRKFARRIERELCDSTCRTKEAAKDSLPKLLRMRSDAQQRYNLQLANVSVSLLLDSAATLAGIDRAFSNVIRQAKKDDIVIFFFAGMSVYAQDSSGATSVFLCTIDAPCETQRRAAGGRQVSPASGITGSKLRLWLESTRAERQLVVLDACSNPEYASELISGMSGADPIEAGLTPRNRVVLWNLAIAAEGPELGGELTHLVTGTEFLLTDAPFQPPVGRRHAFERDLRAREAQFSQNGQHRVQIGVFFERDFLRLLERAQAGEALGLLRGTMATSSSRRITPEYDGHSYALIIGSDTYKAPSWHNLANPVLDARTIAKELEASYGFSVTLLENPDRRGVYRALRELQTLAYGTSDQVFIFIAGHGYYEERMDQGFLVPSDALALSDDEDLATYIPFSNIEGYVNRIPAKHILVALDACFGGTFSARISQSGSRGNETPYGNASRAELIARRLQDTSRLYLASGGKGYVPDGRPGRHSPFASMLLEALRGGGGDDRVLTMTELKSMLERIAPPAPEAKAGSFGNNHPGSDFLFIGR